MANVGAALDWTDEDITRLATITVDTLAQAKAWWHQRAQRRDRDLLDIGSDDEARCERAMDAVLHASETFVANLTDQLRGGSLTTDAWQLAMANEVIAGHCCAVAAAKGGWARVTLEDLV